MTRTRPAILLALLLATAVVAHASRQAAVAPVAMSAFPRTIGPWRATIDTPVDEDTARQLRADAYVNRSYAGIGNAPVDLYIAYYSSQRPGVSIHSPLHCLPGTGWEPLAVTTLDLARPDGSAGSVRKMIVRKNLDRAVVLYWYEVHGRMIASELASKLFLIADSVRLHRSDAALVRVAVPITQSPEIAEQRAVAFVRDLIPQVTHWF
ncbi:MAG TPA: EpsI family protein [Vicinamibacterales bacterium]|nr:EpsI family protein [Vicinamibacterales bacterium]